MSALARTTEIDCDTRAANEDCINGGPRTRTKYTYDLNGNATNRGGYGITWTSYNYPSGINGSVDSVSFYYGQNHQRYETIYQGSIGTEYTYHVGKGLEKVVNNGVIDYRHYIFAGPELVAIYSRMNSGTNTVHYILEDHQSSIANILTSTGTVDVPESFTAYGNRRNGETWSGAPSTPDETAINSVSRWGYTGATMLGVSLGLNHLNGRVEDAITGRFLSPDPHIPDPGNTQSFNRYSYVNNNPLSEIDPSGFFNLGSLLNPFSNSNPLNPFGSVGGKIAAFPFTSSLAALEFGKKQNDSLLRDNTWLQPIAEAAACIWGTPYGCAASSAYLTRLNGGTIQQALIAGAVAYAGSVAYGAVDTGNWATDALATGTIGGTASSLTGGSFTRGFEFAAGASIAGSIYSHYTNQDAQWGAGENRPGLDAPPDQADSNWYVMDNGQIPDSFGNGNLWGLDQPLTGNFWDDFFVQSGPLSSVMDQVPSMQAVAMIHDIWDPNWIPNVPLMFPAVGITWGALLNNYWLVPGYNATRH